MKQYLWGLILIDEMWKADDVLLQPTGETVTVLDNDGNEITVPVMFGGRVSVGDVLNGWVFALFSSTETGIAALQATGAVTVAGLLNEGWPELNDTLATEALAAVNTWLDSQSIDTLPAGSTQHDAIDRIGEYFQEGFDETNYMVG